MAAAMDHDVEVPGRVEVSTEAQRGSGPHHRDLRAAARAAAAHREVPGLRLVEPAVPARRCATRSPERSPVRGTPAGRACSTRSASTSTSSGTPPTSRWTATPIASRRCGSGCSTCCRPARAPSGRAIPGKGLTGTGYDGHAFWDTEGYVLPVLTYTAPDCGRRRTAMAGLDARPGARTRRGARPATARPSRGAPSTARSARRTGRPAPRHGTSTPTSRWRSSAIALSRAMIRWKPSAGWRCSSRRRGCGFAGTPRPPRRLAPRRRHRARRVHRAGAGQRLHEPDGRAQPADGRRGACNAIPTSRRAGRDDRGDGRRGGTRPTPPTFPTTRIWACTSSAKASPPAGNGTSPRTPSIRC